MKLRLLSTALLSLAAMACSAAPDENTVAGSAVPGAGASGGGGGVTIGSGGAAASGGSGVVLGSGGGPEECEAVSQEAEVGFKPVDIIWAVDTSGSMKAEQKAVEQNLNNFAQQIAAAGVDVRVVLIADPGAMCIGAPLGKGSCPGGSNAPNFLHVEKYVGSHSALSAMVGYHSSYSQVLRPNSVKYFTVVTDDNTEPGNIHSATEFSGKVAALGISDWKFFGIFCTGGCSANCVAVGKTYNDLVQQSGGKAGDLCGGNASGFAPVFNSLATSVIENKTLDCSWQIPPPPQGQAFDQQRLNVRFTSGSGTATDIYAVGDPSQCGPNGGWYYGHPGTPRRLEVGPSTCQALQSDASGRVDILFGCVTVAQPQ